MEWFFIRQNICCLAIAAITLQKLMHWSQRICCANDRVKQMKNDKKLLLIDSLIIMTNVSTK